jgi:Flp pilus assembly protein TadB
MTLVVILGLGVGMGLVGIASGLRGQRTPLRTVLAGLSGEPIEQDHGRSPWPRDVRRIDRRVATQVAGTLRDRGCSGRWLDTRLALSNSTLEELSARCLVCSTIGCLLPQITWLLLLAGGLAAPFLIPFGFGIILGLGGILVPIAELNVQAKRDLHHARRVICSFLDLVVLGLAGGMGIESALLAAAQLGDSSVSRRMSAALSLCRDTGEPPWEALSRVGETLGIEELSELAATVGLAGMEGTKVRTTLMARAASIRRHELANAEAEANALTEKLFVPGSLLLLGFLLFIGYPAFTRIAAGF